MTVKPSIKKWFFDRAVVVAALGREEAARLGRAGAFIQRRAKSLLRRRAKASEPGQPPSVHAKSGEFASLKTIYFAWDPGSRSVVVGPVKTNQASGAIVPASTVPSLQERGGSVTLRRRYAFRPPGKGRGKAKKPGDLVTLPAGTTLHYPARPFMGPALEKEREAGTLVGVWKDALKGAA
jgi:hypothetical protein